VCPVSAYQVFRPHSPLLALCLNFSDDWKLRIAIFVNLDMEKLRVPLNTSLGIPQQIRFQDSLNATLMNRHFMRVSCRNSNI
jgi:hypothetical protein